MKNLYYNLDTMMFKSVENINTYKFLYGKEKEEEKEIIDLISSGQEINIIATSNSSKGILEKINVIKDAFKEQPNINIKIELDLDKDYIYEKTEMQELSDVDSHCKENNLPLYIKLNDATGEYENIVIARKQVEDLKEKIDNFTYEENGKQVKLSPYEKFLICYKFVANRVYKENKENFLDERMRNWVGVLSSDMVICSGFSSLLKCVCDRIFSDSELKCYKQDCDVFDIDGNYIAAHANNLVIINDPKYNLNGIFYADSCWDSINKKTNKTSFNYCLIPITKIYDYNYYNLKFDDDLFIYKDRKDNNRQKHPTNEKGLSEFIMHKYGFETNFELYEKTKKILSEKEKKANDVYLEMQQNIDSLLNKFCNKNSLDEMKNQNILLKYPGKHKKFEVFSEFINNINNLENLNNQETINKLNELCDFYTNNEEEIKVANQLGVEKAKQLGVIVVEMSIFDALKRHILYECEKSFKKYDEEEKLYNEMNSTYERQIEQVLEMGKDFIYQDEIPNKNFAKALIPYSKFQGIDDYDINEFIQDILIKKEEYYKMNFGNKQSIRKLESSPEKISIETTNNN